jgi:hypothetical protein
MLDARWSSFFATGDEKYVLPILVVASSEKPTANDMGYATAQWSLKSVINKHPKVAEIKDRFYKNATQSQRKALDELFKVAKTGQ